ncbi:hypothetical protein ZOSMA_96G00710 [Zostera marina]|uniref:Protein kinase domain-containing protein n=1 Tax=Zostera marina TaxID=29655 RepID=A0A0K9NK97_ZOSMR|nr:hypothetical protein ZOSMA_96G00710 [Zostera marina]
METASRKRFPVNPKDYKLYEEVGVGVSATVYRALCIPSKEIVAIKVLDLEKCDSDFDGIRREVHTMSLLNHPNLLGAFCSFTADRSLWVVMPFMAGGSCLHIIKSSYPEGFEELVIGTLLYEVLKALVYLHSHGYIHRDVKAGNILLDMNGSVKLADFGVTACMFDTWERQHARNTFVGTPCWMAPEVMQQLHGYNYKADVWSFGITALELAHGHAPFSKYPPMKVLLMTLQNAPPGLDYERDKRFSKSFKDLVATCLVKDPKKRPTSEKLLKHNFFKRARSNEYLSKSILDGLSPLGDRFRQLKEKEANFILQNKAMYEDKEHLSQRDYIKGISAWNFNLEELKRQAALLDDNGAITGDPGTFHKSQNGLSNDNCGSDFLSSQTIHSTKPVALAVVSPNSSEIGDFQNFEGSFPTSFPTRPLQALKGCFDVSEDDISTSSSHEDAVVSTQKQLSQSENSEARNSEVSSVSTDYALREKKYFSGSILTEHASSPYRNASDDRNRGVKIHRHQSESSYSGLLANHQKRDAHCEIFANTNEETSERKVFQQKGRFKITSEDPSLKGSSSSTNSLTNYAAGVPTTTTTNATGTVSLSQTLLQFILHQNTTQREQLAKLIRCTEQTSNHQTELADISCSNKPSQFSSPSSRENELISYTVQLQQNITNLVEEIQILKLQNAQLQQQLTTCVSNKDDEHQNKEIRL